MKNEEKTIQNHGNVSLWNFLALTTAVINELIRPCFSVVYARNGVLVRQLTVDSRLYVSYY